MKVFDYAIGRDNGDVEVRFQDGSRYDIPVDEWNAIVDAAEVPGRLTHQ
jgi:hypothetical protein